MPCRGRCACEQLRRANDERRSSTPGAQRASDERRSGVPGAREARPQHARNHRVRAGGGRPYQPSCQRMHAQHQVRQSRQSGRRARAAASRARLPRRAPGICASMASCIGRCINLVRRRNGRSLLSGRSPWEAREHRDSRDGRWRAASQHRRCRYGVAAETSVQACAVGGLEEALDPEQRAEAVRQCGEGGCYSGMITPGFTADRRKRRYLGSRAGSGRQSLP